jgi:hypothetical protein
MEVLIFDSIQSYSKLTELRNQVAFSLYFNLCLSFYFVSYINNCFKERLIELQRSYFIILLEILVEAHVLASLLVIES